MGLSQADLAKAMGVQLRLVNGLCHGRRAVTADTALMLARVFGNSAQFWLNAQQASDLWDAMHDEKRRRRLDKARPLQAGKSDLGCVSDDFLSNREQPQEQQREVF